MVLLYIEVVNIWLKVVAMQTLQNRFMINRMVNIVVYENYKL